MEEERRNLEEEILTFVEQLKKEIHRADSAEAKLQEDRGYVPEWRFCHDLPRSLPGLEWQPSYGASNVNRNHSPHIGTRPTHKFPR